MSFFDGNITKFLIKLPIGLIIFRLCLAPTVIGVAYFSYSPTLLFILVSMGLLSDIFDGIFARRLSIASAKLRRMDSQTDLIFWLSVLLAAHIAHPEVVKGVRFELLILLGLEILCYLVSFMRFGKETCTHAYSAKCYGLFLSAGLISILCFGVSGIVFHACFIVGIISGLDVIFITLLLPHWSHDVPSSFHAFQRRSRTSS